MNDSKPYIPADAEWYLADLILEHTIEGDRRNVVHINMNLIQARSPEQAYAKAMALGRYWKLTYTNTEGQRVRVRFRGLRALNVIHDRLEDGAELTYEQFVGVSQATLRRWRIAKSKLGVFAPFVRTDAPCYFPKTVMESLERTLAEEGRMPASAKRRVSKKGTRVP